MGYDIWASGEMTIDATKTGAAVSALVAAIKAEKDEEVAEGLDLSARVSIIDSFFRAGCCCLNQDGSLSLNFGDDSVRHIDDDMWLFAAAAPFVDPSDVIEFTGEDHERWRWEIISGKLAVVDSALVYGVDAHAPDVIQKLVELIYPGGKPVTSSPDYDGAHIMAPGHVMCLSLLEEIEALLRENGFGPQAGMDTLDRLADV